MASSYTTRDDYGTYTTTTTGPGPALMGANTLLGNDVYNREGVSLGDIKEFMIDMASGDVAYAVLSFGGLLGIGDKLFAVPWSALTRDTANKRFTLNMTEAVLSSAPGFDKDNWPSMADKIWAGSVHKFYGTPYSLGDPSGQHTDKSPPEPLITSTGSSSQPTGAPSLSDKRCPSAFSVCAC